ncbi:hypothetical protein AB3S75_021944 [Citrus x aurantiifolia]
MDKKNNNVVDVSTFFIFEATGDSEADFDDPNKAATAAATTTTTIDRDNDDAESTCSHDDDLPADNFPFVNDKDEANGRYYDNVQVCIDDKEEEGEEAHSYHPAWPQEQHNKKSSGHTNPVDSDHEELMSEMEKNKLFWESCLAS